MTVSAEIVKELYDKHANKQMFIVRFGTTKFNLVSENQLKRMYDYLTK